MTTSSPPPGSDDAVLLLSIDRDFTRIDLRTVEVSSDRSPALVPGRRVLFSDEMSFTCIVEAVSEPNQGRMTVVIRRARPITNDAYVKGLFRARDT